MKKVCVIVPDEVAERWHYLARAEGVPLGTFLRLATGTFGSSIAGADPLSTLLRQSEPALGDRILATLAGRDMPAQEIPRMAATLGVKAQSIRGALGSLIAKRKLRLANGTYFQMEG